MKIKLAILENDMGYLQRAIPIFNNKFAAELEIYSFTDLDNAFEALGDKKIDVFLSNEAFDIDFTKIPSRCGFAYLVESNDVHKVNNQKTICKFQKVDLIYKQVLSLYSENAPNVVGISNESNGDMKTIAFTSPAGGVGASTAAAACAMVFAKRGKRVLYLNIETFGSADEFFTCDGQSDFSDIIYAIKSNKTNRTIKLQSTVKQDASGVFYYSSAKIALDMMEFRIDDFFTLRNELKAMGQYDYIIIDMDFPVERNSMKLFECCNSIVMVTNDIAGSKAKINKAVASLQIIDSTSEFAILPRVWLINNESSNHNLLTNQEVRVLGSFPKYEQVTPSQLAKQLALSNIFDNLL